MVPVPRPMTATSCLARGPEKTAKTWPRGPLAVIIRQRLPPPCRVQTLSPVGGEAMGQDMVVSGGILSHLGDPKEIALLEQQPLRLDDEHETGENQYAYPQGKTPGPEAETVTNASGQTGNDDEG